MSDQNYKTILKIHEDDIPLKLEQEKDGDTLDFTMTSGGLYYADD